MTLSGIAPRIAVFALALSPLLSTAETSSIISGSISADFKTRQGLDAAGKAPSEARDEYKVDLSVLDHHVSGSISRQPEVEISYALDAKPANSEKIPVHGKISLGDKGRKMELGGLSLGVVPFSGQIFKTESGKDKKKKTTFRFSKVHLPGITLTPASTLVEGTLTYQYKDDTWVSDLKLSASINGQSVGEAIRGKIKWVEDKAPSPGTAASHYDFDLLLQEASGKAGSLKGSIAFNDVKDKEISTRTRADYNLVAVDVSQRQILNFMKIWIVMVGPTHDD